MPTGQKLPLQRSLNKFAQQKINDAFQQSGQALPCSVTAVMNSIVTVKFEVNSKFTLPPVTVPVFGPEYIRYPIQVGCKGYVIPADVRLCGMSGLGGGVADLQQPANLEALVFFPFGNAGWFDTPDSNAVVLYGPNGVQLRDTGNASNMTLTPLGVVITTPKITTTTTGNTEMTAAAFTLTGPVKIVGTLEVTDAITADSTITATGEVTGNGITLSTHTHGGVQSGGANTGPPEG